MAPINCFLVFCARFAASVSVSQLQLHLQQLNDEIYMFYLESNLFKTHLLYAACVLENCLVVVAAVLVFMLLLYVILARLEALITVQEAQQEWAVGGGGR